jgi:hypothetical protein
LTSSPEHAVPTTNSTASTANTRREGIGAPTKHDPARNDNPRSRKPCYERSRASSSADAHGPRTAVGSITTCFSRISYGRGLKTVADPQTYLLSTPIIDSA